MEEITKDQITDAQFRVLIRQARAWQLATAIEEARANLAGIKAELAELEREAAQTPQGE